MDPASTKSQWPSDQSDIQLDFSQLGKPLIGQGSLVIKTASGSRLYVQLVHLNTKNQRARNECEAASILRQVSGGGYGKEGKIAREQAEDRLVELASNIAGLNLDSTTAAGLNIKASKLLEKKQDDELVKAFWTEMKL